MKSSESLTVTERPLVSIIIRTCLQRNGALAEAIASVVAQTWRPLELIVVEDGSSHAKPLVEAVGATSDIQVQYRAQPREGRCAAGNAGLALARGAYCGFLDDDDQLYANHVDVLMQRLLTSSGGVAAYAAAHEVLSDIESYTPFVKRDQASKTIYRPYAREALWVGNFLPIQAVLFSRALFVQCGGFDTELNNLEDWDLWSRYSVAGEFEGVETVTSLFRVPASADARRARNAALDAYYPLAREKQGRITMNLGRRERVERVENILRQYRMFRLLARCGLLRLRAIVTRYAEKYWNLEEGTASVAELVQGANQLVVDTPILKKMLWLSLKLKRVLLKNG